MCCIGWLASPTRYPEIAEFDLNPVIFSTDGAVVDAKIRLTRRPAELDPYVRRLR